MWDNDDEARFGANDVSRIRRALRASVTLRGNAGGIHAGFDASARGAMATGDQPEETDSHLSLRAALMAHYHHVVRTDTLLRVN